MTNTHTRIWTHSDTYIECQIWHYLLSELFLTRRLHVFCYLSLKWFIHSKTPVFNILRFGSIFLTIFCSYNELLGNVSKYSLNLDNKINSLVCALFVWILPKLENMFQPEGERKGVRRRISILQFCFVKFCYCFEENDKLACQRRERGNGKSCWKQNVVLCIII